ncbi:MAG TPA: YSC84-related protein [Thermoanaerobaculia bacterium]|nr:YSC84-related protein [Thermoanaerobaculia bacterium]HQR67901.1 YSC84-related protein [Thermoanaerobaculia bacterium]
MKVGRILVGSMTLALVFSGAPLAAQEAKAGTGKSGQDWDKMKKEGKQAQIDATAGEALDHLLKSNPKAKELYEKAHGWAAFDNLKIGIGISGGGGKGVAVEKKGNKRTYMSMASGGVGLTLGGEKYQVVFLFADSQTFDNFVRNGWEATAAASAAAGKGTGSQTGFVNGMAVYRIDAKGLMASADISGTKYKVDKDLN